MVKSQIFSLSIILIFFYNRSILLYCSQKDHFEVDGSVDYILQHSTEITSCWSVQSRFIFVIGAAEGQYICGHYCLLKICMVQDNLQFGLRAGFTTKKTLLPSLLLKVGKQNYYSHVEENYYFHAEQNFKIPGLILPQIWPMRLSQKHFQGGTFCPSALHSGIALLRGILLQRSSISDLYSCERLQ